MKFIKKALLSSLVLSALSFTSAAQAATARLDYGVSSFSVTTAIGSFADTYLFDLTQPSAISWNISNNPQVLTVSPSISYSIFDIQGSSFKFGLFDSNNVAVSDSSNLTAGSYSLKVQGIATGLVGGSYNLYANVAKLAVTPVPEPTSSALMLSGLAFMGLFVSRKYKKIN